MMIRILSLAALMIATSPLLAQDGMAGSIASHSGHAPIIHPPEFHPPEAHSSGNRSEVHTSGGLGHGEIHSTSSTLYSPHQMHTEATSTQHTVASTPHNQPAVTGTNTQNSVGGGRGNNGGGNGGGGYGGGRENSITPHFNEQSVARNTSHSATTARDVKVGPSSSSRSAGRGGSAPSETYSPSRVASSKDVPTSNAPFSKDKQALVSMAKKDTRVGITPQDMQAYKDLNAGLTDPFPPDKIRGPESHPGAPLKTSRQPHGHVGPIHHIPIKGKG